MILLAANSAAFAADTAPAKTEAKKQSTSGEKTENKTSESKNTTKKKSTHKAAALLVPPPPPNVPIGPFPISEGGSMPVEYLSDTELANYKTRLTKDLESAKAASEKAKERFNEKKSRVDLFGTLYKEGVISRKEKEDGELQLVELSDQARGAEEKVKDLESNMDRLTARLNAKTKKQTKATAVAPSKEIKSAKQK